MSISNLTPSQLRQAADLQEQIEALKQQVAALIGGNGPTPAKAAETTTPAKPGKRTMSPAHKAKIKAAQKLRWAKYNAARPKTAEER